MNARQLTTLVACFAAAAALTGCDKRIASTATAAPEAVTPISRAYVVESSELVEITRFEDGSIKYTPSGWIVLSTPAQATATAAALRP